MRRTRFFPLLLILILLSANLRIPASTAAASDNQPPDRLAVADYIPPAMTTLAVIGDYAYVGAGPSLLVIDVSDPDHPRRVAYRLLPSYVKQIMADSGRVYVLSRDVFIFDVAEPQSPRLIGDYEVDASCIAIKGMRLFLGSYESFKIVDVSDPSQPVLLSETPNPDPYDYISKIGIFDEYAIITTSRGEIWMGYDPKVYVLDISDPGQPKNIAEFDNSGGVLPQVITDLSIDGNWLAIAGYTDYGKYAGSDFSLFDLSDIERLVYVGGSGFGGEYPSVTIQNQRLYFSVRGSPYCVYNISEPSKPVQVACLEEPVWALVSAGALVYAAGGASGLAIYDSLGPNSLQKRGTLLGVGRALDVALQGKTIYVADGGVVSDPLLFDYTGGGLAIAVPQLYGQAEIIRKLNLDGHAAIIEVQAGLAYLIAGQCYTGFGGTGCEDDLYILNVVAPESISISGSYHFADFFTYQPYAGPISLQNQIAYVPVFDSNESGTGLAVLDVTQPATPTLLSLYKPPIPPYIESGSSSVTGAAITGTFGLASVSVSADGVYTSSLQILDISNSYSLTVQATYPLTGSGEVFIQGSMGFVVNSDDQGYNKVLKLLDISQLPQVQFLSDITTPGSINDVIYDGRYAYVADGEAGLLVYDLDDPLNPVEVYAYDTAGNATSVVKDGDWIYLADDTGGVLKLLYIRHVNPQSYLPLLSLTGSP